MKYLDIQTRRRPEFRKLWVDACSSIMCQCGIILQNQQVAFDHWQQGHLDVYDEVIGE